jgi:hypothetical protein
VNPEFSEFSYGFALTHEIVNRWQGSGITVAPTFPSLYQEGQIGGGYDVRWDVPGMPLLLQFKISQRMLRRSAGEWQHFGQPYYRFWIHARRHSDQHDLLVSLDDGTAEVYYAAPTIHEVADLNRAFFVGSVQQASIFFRPSDIGAFGDDDAHCMAFRPNMSYGMRFSEPKRVPVSGEGLSFSEALRGRLRQRGLHEPLTYFEKFVSLVEERSASRANVTVLEGVGRRRDWPLAVRAGYLSRTILGAELVWIVDESRLSPESLRRLRLAQG